MNAQEKTQVQPEIFLVGVVHGDPEGHDKALELLAKVRPRVISVEISDFSLLYRWRYQSRWHLRFQDLLKTLTPAEQRHPALKKVAAQIDYPFEVQAAQDYAGQHGIPWQAVDLNCIAREHLPRYRRELLTLDNLRNLTLTADGDWRQYILREYKRARRAIYGRPMITPTALFSKPSPQAAMREKIMARRIKRLACTYNRLVHLGGWEHLAPRPERDSLADWLASGRPRIVLLDDRKDL
ncbi:hypothetical protein [Desulfobacca acetoxidans]|uniref:Uncharacterized protein n=1 Tax=Desulfobacca acetoxidans (strain ATCC 700848 / DSM 11109 / ASRB2) TaxID=880072 RepID=F2NGI6_DESAR|nr:hypothetical protein [Desulfobacca acetoxidans]AEB08599.1 hypothetical protein Desac_0719 [Desulfobacca acetoxidans DSM 11109]